MDSISVPHFPLTMVTNQNDTTDHWILCCSCGTSIAPNPAAMCLACITQTTDITESIPKQAIVHFCRNCGRYLNPPNQWIQATLESKELLTLLVKRLRGLNKVKLKEAGFVWTEPHSKRIKVKLTIQKDVFSSMTLQQTFVVEYTVAGQQCEGCTRVMAEQSWRAQVQVRQKVAHKRTFFYLEQLILKHHLHREATQIKEAKDGLDFFFQHRAHAIKFSESICSMLPATQKSSEQLISTDLQNSTCNTRFTYAIELLPICREDLICFTKKQDHQIGGMGPLFLCIKVHSGLVFLNPFNLRTLELSVKQYLRYSSPPLLPVASSKILTEFYVLEIEFTGIEYGKYGLAQLQVARSSDHHVFSTRSHLGHFLEVGDLVLGYDLSTLNVNHEPFEAYYAKGQCEEVVLVKKTYGMSSKLRKRAWKLKSLKKKGTKEKGEEEEEETRLTHQEKDYEQFLRDIEEDPELRAELLLYKDPHAPPMTSISKEEGSRPEVPLEELIDGLHLEDTEPDTDEIPHQPKDTMDIDMEDP